MAKKRSGDPAKFAPAIGSAMAQLWPGDGADWFKTEREHQDLAYRLAAEAAGIGTWYIDLHTQTVMLCPAMSGLLGLRAEYHVMPLRQWRRRFLPEDVPGLDNALASADENMPFDVECRARQRKSDAAWLLIRGIAVHELDTNNRWIVGTCLDISNRKASDEKAKALHQRYRSLAENSPDGILVRIDDCYVYANPAAAKIFGAATADKIISHAPSEFFDAVTVKVSKERGDRLLRGEAASPPLTLLCRRLDGTSAFIEITTAKIDWEGQAAIQTIARDITEQKHIRDQLQIVNKRLKLAVEGSGEGLWDWNVVKDTYTFSGKLREIFDWGDNDLTDRRIDWKKLVHPDDYTRVSVALRSCVTGEKPTYDCEFRLLSRDGGWKWVRSRGVVVAWDDRGKPVAMAGIAADITDRKESEDLVWRHANLDALTGLPNRRLFRDRLEGELRKAQRTQNKLALLFIDLDGFKQINDMHGHDAGDLLLMEAAYRIQHCVRETDIVARLGGDEFTVALTGLDDLDHIGFVCEKILSELSRPFQFSQEFGYVSGSLGIATYELDASDAGELIRKADQAMYAAKKAGKNQFAYFTREMDERAHQRVRLSNDLRLALSRGELTLHYQPLVDLKNGQIVEAEALLRWRHPQLGTISPTTFIPLAEECGLIRDIGNWVFRQAVACSHICSKRTGRLIPIGVNKSPLQFLSRDSGSDWLSYMQQSGQPAGSIVVEITEGVLLHPSPEVYERLRRYAEAGVLVAIDDFGTGYSSMSYLHQFHVDYLKIDGSFVRDIASNPSHRTLARTIIVMAHELGLKAVAEGIETQEQARILLEDGCDYGQGFYYSKPVPQPQLEAMLSFRLPRTPE